MTEQEPTPIPIKEVAAEAARCRDILNNKPADEFSDMLYASYTTLLYVLGYGTAPPSENFIEKPRPVRAQQGGLQSAPPDPSCHDIEGERQ